jgi:hypothetical protein
MKKWITLHVKSRKYLLLMMVSLLVTSLSFAQVRISGNITNAKSNAIVEFVTVQIKNSTFGTTTDNAGNYFLNTNVKPGNYTLLFSGVGFESLEKVITIGNEKSYTVNVQLTESINKLDEVIVTGTSAGTSRKQLGSYVASVSAEDLNKGVH